MANSPQSPQVWNTDDAVALRTFIGNNPKFLVELARHCPEIITDQGTDIAAVTGAKHAGAEAIIEVIRQLQEDSTPNVASTPFIDHKG